MATVTTTTTTEHKILPAAPPTHKEPLKLSWALDQYKFFESTPIIRREVRLPLDKKRFARNDE